MIEFLNAGAVSARYDQRLIRAGASIEGPVLAAERRHHYEQVRDLIELAAALLRAVNREHPLHDGNKRLSVCLCDEFLGLNDHRLDGDDLELAELVWGVAREAGSLTDSTVAERLRPFVREGRADVAFAERHPETIDNLAN